MRKIESPDAVFLTKHAELPDVPLVTDLATNDEQRQILKIVLGRQVLGRPYAAPPGVPADRVAALRKAFMDTMVDPEFRAEVERAKSRSRRYRERRSRISCRRFTGQLQRKWP